MSPHPERPYTVDDLTVNKKALVKFVERQIGKWPSSEKKFSSSKHTVSDIRRVLLDPGNGFTTNLPPVSSPHPPKQGGGSQTEPQEHGSIAPPSPPPPPHNGANEASCYHFAVSVINLRVYIEDIRISPAQRTVAILSLNVSRKENGSPVVFGRDFLAALQKSNGAIEIPSTGPGSVRLSFPDPEDNEWKVPFIRITHGPTLVATFDPETIEIAQDYRFKLQIDNVPFASNQSNASVSSDLAPTAEALQGEVSATSELHSTPANSNPETDLAVQFLRKELATRDGYSSFADNRGKFMSNAVIAADWRFAVDFTKQYNRIKSPVKINKESIYTALGVGSTWLSQAHKATQLIDKHKADAAVTTELAKDEVTGSGALYEFLVNYDKANSTQG
ncbi:hypothetical protein R3P38DRAFT_3190768 [Favolaschia claudopus]|uniref:Uncharacterized protein n=1 Tax=Favolaschia claudopus TaxID=2862362 RepID=A0AAW0BNJ7_9AGAR